MLKIGKVTKERRADAVKRMSERAIWFPYTDPTDLQQLRPEGMNAGEALDFRYLASQFILSEDTLTEVGLPKDFLPSVLLCQYLAARYAIGRITTEKGQPKLTDVAQIIGVNASSLYKYGNGRGRIGRPLTLRPSALERLSYSVLHESCHKVMFGETRAVRLPQPYAGMILQFSKLGADEKKEILSVLKDIYIRAGGAMERSSKELGEDRLRLMLTDAADSDLFLSGWQKALRVRRQIALYGVSENTNAVADQDSQEEPDDTSGDHGVSFMMFLAIETGQALDFFVAEHFGNYAPLVCMTKDGAVPVKDKYAQVLVDYLFSTSANTRRDILTALTAGLHQTIADPVG